ncbi:MAG TPA: DnaJ C-terminal domain-containing protein, partial [Candidatus Ozemobacteraceae bacterium]|nr:DnaJ C-terminal domain-containing protein [Candidatus Ozemobacteraceae bacterium]
RSAPGSVLSVHTSDGTYQLEVAVEDDPPFTLKGNQIETTINLNLAQAMLGSKVKMRDPSGEEIILTIPAGSQPGDKLRLRGLGFSGADLIVKLDVQLPKNLPEAQKKELADLFDRLGLRY